MKFFLFTLFIIVSYVTSAQADDLMVKSSDKGLYVDHKVAAKENFYSIGRLYNMAPREIAAYNKVDMEKGLSLGQVIRIPLTAMNFSQTTNEGAAVYYKVGEKEGLMKVSNANNKVTLENLRRWNNLSSDNVNEGDKLIIGFIVSGQIPTVTADEPVKKLPVEEKKEVNETKEPIVQQKQTETGEIKMASPKATLNTVVIDDAKTDAASGYFKSFFEKQVKILPVSKNETVTSGIFKTASGWQDTKYYLLINRVQPGTIIKIVNPTNNKYVYAKVLGEMNGIRQNAGYDIRISNSAASTLEISETDKFIVKLNY